MTREEAIKILRREIECLSHTKCEDCILEAACDPIKTTPYDSEYIEVYEMAIKALEKNEGKWIPVSERLPENNEDVLVYNNSDILVAWYSEIVRSWGSLDDRFDEYTPIIAWQPLPEPYKGVSE